MADALTTNFELTKVEEGSTDWALKVNDNMDSIDTELKALEDEKAAIQSGATEDNFASFDADGDIQDSGQKHADYAGAGVVTTHEASYDHTKIHDVDTDDYLDKGGSYQVTAQEAKAAYDNSQSKTCNIELIIDGGGSAITTGVKAVVRLDWACAITGVTMLAPLESGSIVVDIWNDTYANFPPTNDDSITASAPPTITTAQKSEDTTLTGWTKAIAAGDVLAFNVDSVTDITLLTLVLKVTKT